MKIVVFGAGKMGWVVAWDLCQRDQVTQVTLCDSLDDKLEAAKKRINSRKLHTLLLDVVRQRDQAVTVLREHASGAIVMPSRGASYALVRAAIDAKTNVVDILEESHHWPDEQETEDLDTGGLPLPDFGQELHEDAATAGITVLDGMGFEPGLANVTAEDGIRRLDQANRVLVRVGGVASEASKSRRPAGLGYMTTWAFGHVLREYMVPALTIDDGKFVTRKAVEGPVESDPEAVWVPHASGAWRMEASCTPGMPTFPRSHPELVEFNAKTLRWPGHWQAIRTLKQLGLLDDSTSASATHGRRESARQFLADYWAEDLKPRADEKDLCVLQTTVIGRKDGQPAKVLYEMAVEGDAGQALHRPDEVHLSAMAKVTAFPAAWAAVLLANKKHDYAKGIVAPEELVHGELYRELVQALGERTDGHQVEIRCSIQASSGE